MPTKLSEFWKTIKTFTPKDTRIEIQQIYAIVESNIQRQADDFEPDAPESEGIRWKRNVRNVLQQHKGYGDLIWFGGGEYLLPSSQPILEMKRRMSIWNQLLDSGGPNFVSPNLLNQLRIYRGGSGIWIDKASTETISTTGITVWLLHTGEFYPDLLQEDGLLYHYPDTERPKNRDLNEIEATRLARRNKLPLFIVTNSLYDSSKRDVKLGWVEGWDDSSQLFLIRFDDKPPLELVTSPRQKIYLLSFLKPKKGDYGNENQARAS